MLTVGFPGTPAYVHENPGSEGLDRPWPKHQVFDWVSNESPHLVDITGNGKRELVCTRDGFYGFATYEAADPFSIWEFHPVSEQIAASRFGHGLGVGDTDGDGTLDRRTVFYDGLNLVSGLEVGFGGVWVGVWVGATPHLLFIPDRDGDDVPDGDPEVVLDGWGYQDTHETLNAFIWGPDGWLYGCHGVFTHSAVGKPGTPDDERVRINAAVWRYHPTREEFEVFAHGTSNPCESISTTTARRSSRRA